jgi:mannose-6-phosphate isomerase class I
MGYFINPVRFDDHDAINIISDIPCTDDSIIQGVENIIELINSQFHQGLIVIDGYLTASLEEFAKLLLTRSRAENFVDINSLYKTSTEINDLIAEYLPENRDVDPELIYGKLFAGNIQDYFDTIKVKDFVKNIDLKEKTILFGHGCLSGQFADIADQVIYIDVTPKDTAFRINEKKYTNIGNHQELDFDAMARRAYFIDAEIATKIRRHAITNNSINYYILEKYQKQFTCIKSSILYTIFNELSKHPFRPKPVYIDGVWGGQFIKKIRHIPDEVASKIAWSFELIATEASVALDVNSQYLDIPFLTIMDAVGRKIIGDDLYSQFNGYFPVRFNYDDTWHSNGNMSIQCHPTDEIARSLHGDFAGQSEAYYIVTTGHDARTYCGFLADEDGREFLRLCKQSEISGNLVPYRNYINAIISKPGLQVFIPAGTVHGSGRNQVVLELGSLTINAYTYKIYDYTRKDDNGKLRPIHTKLAERSLNFNRNEKWVRENVAFDPILVDEQADYQEFLIGRTDLMYFETYKVNLKTKGIYCGHNDDAFSVFTVVDGEEVEIRSKENPEHKYHAKYLDVVVIPAGVKEFIVQVLGEQPVVLHKTVVRRSMEVDHKK